MNKEVIRYSQVAWRRLLGSGAMPTAMSILDSLLSDKTVFEIPLMDFQEWKTIRKDARQKGVKAKLPMERSRFVSSPPETGETALCGLAVELAEANVRASSLGVRKTVRRSVCFIAFCVPS
eukprot:TRINITY_DN15038_c0_g1_i2.p2 TRINITY_DN15038_c0_g1~~TRINITY_DN15038_c0_g1_i2.p2  ORF type:complete len:121 (+),score=13.88 TRINITY_DN15038_c0_g1_i2:129-491(+)